MTLTYFDNGVPHLIEEYYQLTFNEDTVPFQSTVLPVGLTHITHLYYGNQKAVLNTKEMPLVDTIVSGQFFRSYQLFCSSKSLSFGISFHPTALFKILKTDISKLDNKHISLKEFHPEFQSNIQNIFDNFTHTDDLINALNTFFSNIELTIDKNTENIDLVIDLIKKQDGLLNINDILEHLNISQKTLETQFNKIVGLTPGKYIRLYRFLRLMRKYENREMPLKDLIFMFDYYDRSHFSKDFKLFMNETPKSYFKKDYPLLKAVFKNN